MQYSNKLTVVFRDDSPLLYCNDSPTYRSVQIELTDEQMSRIAPKPTMKAAGMQCYEEISRCFIEPQT